MKRILSFILSLILLMGAALAAPGDANLGMNINDDYMDNINSAAVVGDTLYLQGYNNMFSWRMGEGDLTAHPYTIDPTGDGHRNVERIFSDGETLYALMSRYSSDGNYRFQGVELCEVTVDGDQVSFGESTAIENEDLVVEYDDYSYMVQINSITCDGEYMFLQMYTDDGYPAVYVLDMATGEGSFIDVENAQTCCLYEDGTVLIGSADYVGSAVTQTFYIYDPMSESLTPAADPIEVDRYYSGMVYSQESGRLFYQDGGYVMACTDFDFENAAAVAELSMAMYSDAAGLLLPGDYYVFCSYDVTSVRNTQPDSLPETRLVIGGDVYHNAVSKAYYSMGNKRGDVAVILSNNYQQDSAIIEGMMNRDSSTDIYIMQTSRQAYDAMYNRGYMAELDNPELIALVEGMYPGLQKPITRDGSVLAVPVNLYGWQMVLNYEGLEKLGIAREDVPTDWLGFIDFLAELADLLPEDNSIQLVESSWTTQEDLRNNLLSSVFECYYNETVALGETPDYNCPELEQAMQAIMDFDFSVFGLAETYEDLEENNGRVVFVSGSSSESPTSLLETSVGVTLGNFYSNWGSEPLLLSLRPDAQPVLPVEMSVALINPFSENRELAQEFLVELCNNMETGLRYNINDELSEPKRYTWYEENLKSMQESIDQMKAQLETAEPVDVPMLEQAIADNEKYLAESAENDWEIAPKDIEWYRAHAANLFVSPYNYLEGDPTGEVWTLMSQLYEEQISVSDFLKEVGKKARMMALEGN